MRTLLPRLRPIAPLVTLALVAALGSGCGATGLLEGRTWAKDPSGTALSVGGQSARALVAQENLGPNWEPSAYAGHYERGCLVNASDPLDFLNLQEARVDFQHVDQWPTASNVVWMADQQARVEAAFAEIKAAIRRCTEIKMLQDGWHYELEVLTSELVDGTDADDQVGYEAYGTITSPDDEEYEAYFRGTYLRHGTAATAVFTDDVYDSPLHEALVELASRRLVAVMSGDEPPADQIDKSGQA